MDPGIRLAGSRVDDGEIGNVVGELRTVRLGDEQVACEQRVPGLLGHHPHREAVGGVRPRVTVLHEQVAAAQVIDDRPVNGVEPVGRHRAVHVAPGDAARARRLVHEEPIARRTPGVGAGATDQRPRLGHGSLAARHRLLVERSRGQVPEDRCRVDDSDRLQPLVSTHVQHPPLLQRCRPGTSPRAPPPCDMAAPEMPARRGATELHAAPRPIRGAQPLHPRPPPATRDVDRRTARERTERSRKIARHVSPTGGERTPPQGRPARGVKNQPSGQPHRATARPRAGPTPCRILLSVSTGVKREAPGVESPRAAAPVAPPPGRPETRRGRCGTFANRDPVI